MQELQRMPQLPDLAEEPIKTYPIPPEMPGIKIRVGQDIAHQVVILAVDQTSVNITTRGARDLAYLLRQAASHVETGKEAMRKRHAGKKK